MLPVASCCASIKWRAREIITQAIMTATGVEAIVTHANLTF